MNLIGGVKSARQKLFEPFLSPIAKSVRKQDLTYLSPIKVLRIERALKSVIRQGVQGDVIEFGTALGGSAIVMASIITPPRRFIGLDVFEMIPPPNPQVDDADAMSRYERISSGQAEGIGEGTYYGYRENLYDYVCEQFENNNLPVDGANIQLHKGLFEEAWPRLQVTSIAFAHIDCDWYDPVVYCLNAIADLVSPGGVIVIDDYHDYRACRKAVDEFLNQRSDYLLEPGRNPILRRR